MIESKYKFIDKHFLAFNLILHHPTFTVCINASHFVLHQRSKYQGIKGTNHLFFLLKRIDPITLALSVACCTVQAKGTSLILSPRNPGFLYFL